MGIISPLYDYVTAGANTMSDLHNNTICPTRDIIFDLSSMNSKIKIKFTSFEIELTTKEIKDILFRLFPEKIAMKVSEK